MLEFEKSIRLCDRKMIDTHAMPLTVTQRYTGGRIYNIKLNRLIIFLSLLRNSNT